MHVLDVPTPPTIPDVAVTIAENQALNAVVVASINGVDPEGQSIVYNIDRGNVDQTFFMHRDSGQIIVQRRNAPNYEARTQYVLECTGTDTAGNTTSFTVTIAISDVNESPYISTSSTSGSTGISTSSTSAAPLVFNIPEKAGVGSLYLPEAGMLYLVDPEDDALVFSTITYVGPNDLAYPTNAFTVGTNSAGVPQLTLNLAHVLDHETQSRLTMKVNVTGTGSTGSSSTAAHTELVLYVNVLDEPERPMFDKVLSNRSYHVVENTKTGSFLDQLPSLSKHVTDPDRMLAGSLKYFLAGTIGMHGSTTTMPPLTVHRRTGQLRVAYLFDFEQLDPPLFRVVVGVTDPTGLTDTVVLTIVVGELCSLYFHRGANTFVQYFCPILLYYTFLLHFVPTLFSCTFALHAWYVETGCNVDTFPSSLFFTSLVSSTISKTMKTRRLG